MNIITKYYCMILAGLPEHGGKIKYRIRTDRPWNENELWGFTQIILVEEKEHEEG